MHEKYEMAKLTGQIERHSVQKEEGNYLFLNSYFMANLVNFCSPECKTKPFRYIYAISKLDLSPLILQRESDSIFLVSQNCHNFIFP